MWISSLACEKPSYPVDKMVFLSLIVDNSKAQRHSFGLIEVLVESF